MQHIFKGSIQVAVVGVLLRVTAEQCCHCWFFSLDLFFYVLSGVLRYLLKIWVFLNLVKFSKCML